MRCLLLVVLLAGCSISLEGRPVRSIEAAAYHQGAVCPGDRVELQVIARLDDGDALRTRGAGRGRVAWSNYRVRARGGRVREGRLYVSRDPRATADSGLVELGFRSRHHPGVRDLVRLPVTYACPFVTRFEGRSGAPGRLGRDGRRGRNGRRDGEREERGSDGSDGSDGGHGGDGGPGPAVRVRARTIHVPRTGREMVWASVHVAGYAPRVHLVDPRGGSLLVLAAGGRGGDGGAGGRGGRGGRNGGRDGRDGVGGTGGDGGRGGSVLLELTTRVRQLGVVRASAPGGRGGLPGNGELNALGPEAGRSGRSGRVRLRVLRSPVRSVARLLGAPVP